MLVRKISSEWFPSENPTIKVGEIVEITNPRNLIINGDVEAVGENGEVLSSFELYGQASKSEMEEFKNFMDLKKAEATKVALEKQQEELSAKLSKVEAVSKEEPAPLYVAKKDRK